MNVFDQLTGVYDYVSPDGRPEQGSFYQWYSSASPFGESVQSIPGATSVTFNPPQSLEGRYIAFQVVPRDGVYTGQAVMSPYVGPIGPAVRGQNISPPIGFPWTPPFSINKVGPYQYETDFNPDDYIVDSSVTYYLSPDGDDSNDGLSAGSPKLSIDALITELNANPPSVGATLILDQGVYAEDGGVSINFPCNIIGGGLSVVARVREVDWALAGGSTYVTNFTDTNSIVDLTNTDEYGIPIRLREVATRAECDETPNTFITGASNLYIHLAGSRTPDADVLVFDTPSSNWLNNSSSSRLFMRGVHVWGYGEPVFSEASSTLVFDNCSFRYSQASNGITNRGSNSQDSIVILHNCDASYNSQDGFSYGVRQRAIEIDCRGVWNGYVGDNDADNGSTAHNNSVTIRINGIYRFNDDRNVHDVNNTNNWLLGCVAGDAQNGSADPYDNANFICGGSAGSTSTWMEGCRSLGGSASDIVAGEGGGLRVFMSSGMELEFELGSGTISTDNIGDFE